MPQVRVRRIYDSPGPDDGFRVLVDRLWPRGLSRDAARIDLWLKDVAPSHALRQWFSHDPGRWPEFRSRYFAELDQHPESISLLRDRLKAGNVTLLYAARDREHNQAVALAEFLA